MIKCTPLICSKHEKYAAVITDYAAGIADKLIRRHPHVFADVVYASETEQKQAWEELKVSERAEKEVENHTILAGVAKNLPALVQCKKNSGSCCKPWL
ncbi:[similarity to] nucleoside triphosphate pyrophosphohydrolase [methanotrophic bacterial endosymbiont of Bathymodiolus sp.]|nr:[similarity to] nucleoside triphosphate pyrophosphohydrolase [methanotrophic bacterial endosymbiont of Bathymodiolus sp.]